MGRPTITLALIAKNEEKNVPILFESVRDCFDHIVFVDTGSNDRTVEVAKTEAEKINTPIEIRNFTWVKDFAAARNESYRDIKTDYVMWLDLDDVLSDREAFINFRDESLMTSDYWFSTYDYAHNEKGEAVISFVRERICKVSKNPVWKYFLHEGVPPEGIQKMDYITTWKVVHRRTAEDAKNDKNRNLEIFNYHLDKGEKLDPRMTFYYGKELFESGDFKKSIQWLLDAACIPELEIHDRLLATQYAAYGAVALKSLPQARQICLQGLQMDPTRAEFYICIADSYLQEGKMVEALPYYSAAKKCIGKPLPGSPYAGAIFHHPDAYSHYPMNMIAEILMHLGRFDEAFEEAKSAFSLYKNEGSKLIIDRITEIKALTRINEDAEETNDIVISCPPQGMYEWDEKVYEQRGIGGSETAAVEMAKYLHKFTGRPVKVFNPRPLDYTSVSGVEYISTDKLNLYFSRYKPFVHIAWRHNIKLTTAPTYLWCHDLLTPTVETFKGYDKMFCLSEFHKRFVISKQGVDPKDIIVTKNGIEPKRFVDVRRDKDPNKIIWSSSPDRGLFRAIRVIEKARETKPDLELHIFYGFHNLYKNGPIASQFAKQMEEEISKRPWIKYHGNVTQTKLTEEMKTAAIWLYPTDFLETYCITAIECILSNVYPIVRRFGALPDTLKRAVDMADAMLVDSDCETEKEVQYWSGILCKAIDDKPWMLMNNNPLDYAWESVAKEWIDIFNNAHGDKSWKKVNADVKLSISAP
jgi:glycosyltransferase involved in cell wall biosynthesis